MGEIYSTRELNSPFVRTNVYQVVFVRSDSDEQ
jgi:hypothetical protein